MNNQTILTLLKLQLLNKRSVEITVAGNSMNPVLNHGEHIRVEHRDSYEIGDILVFSYKNQELLVHRLLRKKNGKYFCKGDNSMRLEDITEEQIMGVVIINEDKNNTNEFVMASLHIAKLFRNCRYDIEKTMEHADYIEYKHNFLENNI